MTRPNGYQLCGVRDCVIPDRVIERIRERTVEGALHVARSRRPCDLWIGGVNNAGRPQIGWFDADAGVDRYGTVAQINFRLERLDGGLLAPYDVICHTCDVGTCVSVEHMYLGDSRTNGSDLKHRNSARSQGVLAAEVAKQIHLRNVRDLPVPAWLDRHLHLAAEQVNA